MAEGNIESNWYWVAANNIVQPELLDVLRAENSKYYNDPPVCPRTHEDGSGRTK